MTADTLTILTTAYDGASRKFATKIFIADAELTPEHHRKIHGLKAMPVTHNGQIWERSFDLAMWFTVAEHPVGSLEQLAVILSKVQGDPCSLVIRGTPTEAAFAAMRGAGLPGDPRTRSRASQATSKPAPAATS